MTVTYIEHWNKGADTLIVEIGRAENLLAGLRTTLHRKQSECKHEFGPVMYDPIIHEGYQDHGDPPGTMGVDRRLPSWVSRQEIPVWKRTCSKCLLTQETRQTRDDVKKVPVF